ncbi:hypothetical protein [Azotobacter beijerinckii]|uniref:hypothetical protein n=1 Tax=Azotobacter beijerinckii TaxID=170623 RepID=UPI000B84D76D|nr:hypothetical protein [Azotobacter beijerinckii]
MKKLLLFPLTILSFSVSAGFINPAEFNGSEKQKEEVISYIRERVKKDYCQRIDMCQESMLRMMETENLEAFKRLTKAKDKKVLDRAIHDYCGRVDMCSYQTIEMMYDENVKAKNKELSW